MSRTLGEGLFGEGMFSEIPSPVVPFLSPADYTFIVEDVMSRQIIGELPLNDVSYEDYLRRPGSLRATLPMGDADKNRELLDAGRRAIYVLRDGNIEWGGLLLDPIVPLGAETVNIACIGWLGWLDRRDIWIDRQFTNTDQFLIFKTLVDDAQDESNIINGSGADLGITTSWAALSGVLRDRLQEYRYFSGKNLGDALRQLAALDDGFDYGMRYTLGAGGIVKQILLSYPQQGADHSNEIGFEYVRGKSGNILRRGVEFRSSDMAWRIRGWGVGNDVTRLVSTQVTEEHRGVYPFFDGQGSFSSVVNQDVLDDNTLLTRKSRDHVVVLPSIEVDPDLDPKWASLGLGDIYNVDLDDGYCSASGAHRIIGYKMDADRDRPTLYLQGV